MAGHKGHEFMWVKNVDHQLRHEADSDELRAVAEESSRRKVCASIFTGKNRANQKRDIVESFVAGCGMTPYPAGNIMQI